LYLQGNLQQTGNNKDLAIQGTGFFQVLMPDGTLSYTRDGSFQVNSEGLLVTASGYPVQPSIAIPSDAQTITVGRDGTVSVVQPGSVTPNTVGTIELASFMNPAGLSAQGENVFIETASSGPPIINAPDSNGMGYLSQGYIETSNVNVVEEMTNMIQAQRAYEINSKAVTAADQMLQKLTQM